MAASGSQNQYPLAANTNQATLKTIPADFRFNTIGQAPGLLRRITTPDAEVPVSASPSPSPPASPKLDSSQSLASSHQSQMKSKASLLERITGPGAAAAPPTPVAGTSQSIFAAGPTRANAPAETQQSTTASQPRTASLQSSDDNSNTASGPLPKLDTVPEVPLPDSAMDVDSPIHGGPASVQPPPSLPTSGNTGENPAPPSPSTARRVDQPSGSQPLSPYVTLRNRLEGISEALLKFPTVNMDEADRLLAVAKAQSTAALKSANHAQETTNKALECLREAMKAVGDCITAAQESGTRTDAAMAAVAALAEPACEAERQRFIAPIREELDECRQAMDQMEERLQKQRQMRAQRQLQASAQATAAITSTRARTVESAAAAEVTPIVASGVAPAVDSPAASTVAPPAAPASPTGSTHAAQAGTEPQAAGSRSPDGGAEQFSAHNGEQKEESKDLTFDEYLRRIEAADKAFQEEQKRQYDAHRALIGEIVAKMQRTQERVPAAAAQNVQVAHGGGSSQTQQSADGLPTNDRMIVDDEDELKHLREETRSAVPNEVRQRMIKERLEAERQAVERRRSEEEDRRMESSATAEEEKLLQQNVEEGRRQQAILRRQIEQQKRLAVADEARNINARRALLKQTSPTDAMQAQVHLKDEPPQSTETVVDPTSTKSTRQTGKAISGNALLGAVDEGLESKKKPNRAIADADSDRNIRRIDTKNRTPSQPNSVSPTTRINPLPNDIDYAMKHQVTGLESNYCNPSIATNGIPIPVALPAGLPPRPHSLTHQGPPAAAHTKPMLHQQVATLPLKDQHASQQATSSQETHVVFVKREPDEEDIKPPQWNADAPMTPDSLPPDDSTSYGGPSEKVKREGSITIPMLSLPSPSPAAPPATSSEFVPQTSYQHEAAANARPEQPQNSQTAHFTSGAQCYNDSNVPDTENPEQHTRARSPSGGMPFITPVSFDAPRGLVSIPAAQSLSVRPEYMPPTQAFVPMEYHPPVPALVVTQYNTPAKTNPDAGRVWGQSIPESHSSSSANSDTSNKDRPAPQRRIGGDHYSPSPSSRRSRSRSRSRSSRPLPPRGDHYSPRRNSSPGRRSPAPRYPGGYSRYSADRSGSRGPISASNSRNASPNPYGPPIGFLEPPLAPANHGRKRPYAGGMPQGPTPRRPRYDEPRHDNMQAGPSRSYVSEQDIRDERNFIANRGPSPSEYRSRPLEERLRPNPPSDAPQTYNRGRQPNHEPNDRYNDRRSFAEDYVERHRHDRPPPPNPDRRPPPPSYQEIHPSANANNAAPRPNLLSRLGSGNEANDLDYDPYYDQQSTNNHHNNHQNNRGGPRRGRGTAPTAPRGGKNSLINRIEG